MNERIYRLKVKLPFLVKGAEYLFDDDTGFVYRIDTDGKFDHPLRSALAGYLYLLITEDEKYLERIE